MIVAVAIRCVRSRRASLPLQFVNRGRFSYGLLDRLIQSYILGMRLPASVILEACGLQEPRRDT